MYHVISKHVSSLDNIYVDHKFDNFNNFKKFSIWTFDTGSSEHITNNKNLLNNFKYKTISMKCANNTECIFEGYGSYTGIIIATKLY